MIREVKKDRITYGDLPNKYEAGTMATAQVIAFDQSIKFLENRYALRKKLFERDDLLCCIQLLLLFIIVVLLLHFFVETGH